MERSRRRLVIAIGVGLISDLWPIPGAVLAALVFPEGIHSSSPSAYLVLSYGMNFALFAGLAYAIAANWSRQPTKPVPERNGLVKGIIYRVGTRRLQ